MMMQSKKTMQPYKILKIRKQKNLYELLLANNETYLCNEDDIFEYKLYAERVLGDELVILKSKDEYYRCLNKGLDIINYKQYSIKQVKERLLKYHFSYEVIEQVIDYFIKLNILNDDDFYENYVSFKKNQGYGPIYIKNKLNSLGINKEVIFPYELQYELIEKQLLKYKNIKDTKKIFENKFITKMIKQGFNDTVIKEVLNDNEIQYQNTNLKRDYLKLVGQDRYKIKQKLLRKGYTSDEVEAIIQEVNHED